MKQATSTRLRSTAELKAIDIRFEQVACSVTLATACALLRISSTTRGFSTRAYPPKT